MKWLLSLSCAALLMGCVRVKEHLSGNGTAAPQPPGTAVTFKAADGVSITGDWVSAKGKMAVILLPMRGHDATSWNPYQKAFTKKGISTIAIDPRGVGRSERQGNQTIEAAWDLTLDIEGAVQYLKSAGKTAIGIAGASYGANNALIYAAERPAIKAIALLSPGDDYHGLKIAEPVAKYKGAILVLTATGDKITSTGPDTIRHASDATVVQYDGDEHGTDLLNAHKDALDQVLAFFVKNLK